MSDRGQHIPPSADTPAPAPADDEPIQINDTPFALTGEDEPDPRDAESSRKMRRVVLGALLTVSLAGAATLGYFGWNVNSQRNTTLSAPPTIGALTLNSTEDASATAEYLQGALSAEISMDKTVGGVYSGAGGKNVLFFGGTTLLWSPEKDLENSFDLIADEEGAVTGLHDVDAGELGGVMKCGITNSEGAELTVCGWADHGSLALAMFPDQPESEAAPLMLEIRKATQTRD
ncbi:hypothetical protein [Actinoplanes aureus]|uniref:Uncharacterized protein n=1 Tax=Actinoplanes aureus TaxID=2792083 RepID=A0A931G288_9ACTN|nr:hypothetical protein [Actinoplanes aureus]MBG0568783.1 hypothetical protein [Actinoplanes aureus]